MSPRRGKRKKNSPVPLAGPSRGLKRYFAFAADYGAHFVDPLAKKTRDPNDVTDAEAKLFDTFFSRFGEISEALDNLDLCLQFISSRPPRRRGLRLDQYLLYHITFYLQEMYILNERLDAYLTLLQRIKRRVVGAVDDARYESHRVALRASLSGVVKVRGAHVHSRGFRDEKLRMLHVYSLLSSVKDEYVEEMRFEYRFVRTEWIRTMRANKESLETVLDTFFDFVYDELTSGPAEMIPNFSKAWAERHLLGGA